jgi:iron only hydrogenase large subunit-like protein
LTDENQDLCYIRFKKEICTGCGACLKVCPTEAIRIRDGSSIRLEGICVGCGECLRVCPVGAVASLTYDLTALENDEISIALVSPVLYSQFPGVMPKDILLGLRKVGFQHTIDMSYFAEMFQFATEEFLLRNRVEKNAPQPLLSPVCPVVVRLISYRFPNLIPNLVPILRPVALMAREVKNLIAQQYGDNNNVALYYINPCPTKAECHLLNPQEYDPPLERSIGINDVYLQLSQEVHKIMEADQISFYQHRFEYETCATGNGPLWGMSGGEINDINIDRTLAVSGMNEVISYLDKIELGLFEDMEYMEFRVCTEGCIGGALTAIDKYLAKSVVQKMIRRLGLGKRLSPQRLRRLYEKGWFKPKKGVEKLVHLFGEDKSPLSIEERLKIDEIMTKLKRMDCGTCGAPTCRAFAEDVVRGKSNLADCIELR